jgi:hypothetical protein
LIHFQRYFQPLLFAFFVPPWPLGVDVFRALEQ